MVSETDKDMKAVAESENESSLRYRAPRDVLSDPGLSRSEKRSVLRRWALEAFRVESMFSRGNANPELSYLDEVIDALIDLDEPDLRGLHRPPIEIVSQGKRIGGVSTVVMTTPSMLVEV